MKSLVTARLPPHETWGQEAAVADCGAPAVASAKAISADPGHPGPGAGVGGWGGTTGFPARRLQRGEPSPGEPVSGRVGSADGCEGSRRARAAPPRDRFSPDDRRRTLLARAGLLSRQLRLLPRGHDRRAPSWPRHARALRRAGCRRGGCAMTTTVYVPADAGALPGGAGEGAKALTPDARRRRAPIKLVRHGPR